MRYVQHLALRSDFYRNGSRRHHVTRPFEVEDAQHAQARPQIERRFQSLRGLRLQTRIRSIEDREGSIRGKEVDLGRALAPSGVQVKEKKVRASPIPDDVAPGRLPAGFPGNGRRGLRGGAPFLAPPVDRVNRPAKRT